MRTVNRKPDFFETAEGIEVIEQLHSMVDSSVYSTEASYSANTTVHPDNKISFVEKHKNYLKQHQNVNPRHYMSNLRLMTKLK